MAESSHRTVFHVPEGGREYVEGALGNVENLLADGTIEVEAALVANGGGVEYLLADAPTAGAVRGVLDAGVEVCACENTIRKAAYSADDLLPGVRLVSSAMAELTRRQAAGYAYVRP